MRSTSCASSCSLPASPSMSSANLKLVMVRHAMLTVPSCSSSTSDIILSRKMLKSVGDICTLGGHPTVRSVEPFSNIAIDENCAGSRSYRLFITLIKLLPMLYYCLMIVHMAACHTLSNAFLKSMKTW